eukprot:CAMPEP_0197027436 /NCGR_PEP_ID=MMETSP1384-20130603/7339_1 /TAXON_ID=29189 /ORGANISM="Ammonia sp." /LENGTH=131 /DNA_ID=CAMNT_0042456275 /DNA_START=109 /DNA_END=501 /DNA_ORIENTATION=-
MIPSIKSQASCKAVEWEVYGLQFAFAMDVCFNTYSKVDGTEYTFSYWYRCESGEPFVMSYSSADCAGHPTVQQPLSEYLEAVGETGADITAYCDLPACEYVNVALVTCSEDQITTLSSVPYIDGYCNTGTG